MKRIEDCHGGTAMGRIAIGKIAMKRVAMERIGEADNDCRERESERRRASQERFFRLGV